MLLLSGELDPTTPPQWAAMTASRRSGATDILFRGVGHGVIGADACAGQVVGQFLSDPMKPPHSDCVAALRAPHFVRLESRNQ
jgi:hypothetical protein